MATLAAIVVAAGCSSGNAQKSTATTTTVASSTNPAAAAITLLGARLNTGPYRHSLSMKLVDGTEPISFYVCAAWSKSGPPDGCRGTVGAQLPIGATIRLEQRPAGPGLTHSDSPGWGTVATSDTPELHAVLSNGVTGNKLGLVTFRATLRSASDRVLARSNPFTLTWHK